MNYNEDGLFYGFLLVRLFQMISICFNVYRSVLSLFADRKSIRFLGEEWKEGTLSNVEIEEKIMRSWDVSHVEDNLDSWIWRVFWIVKTVSFFFWIWDPWRSWLVRDLLWLVCLMLFRIAQPALNPCASVKDIQLTYHLEKNGKNIKSMAQVPCFHSWCDLLWTHKLWNCHHFCSRVLFLGTLTICSQELVDQVVRIMQDYPGWRCLPCPIIIPLKSA